MPLNERALQLKNWFTQWLEAHHRDWGALLSMQMVSGDASFRRYFRMFLPGRSLIAVDAPPQHENNPAFVAIASALRAHGLVTPEVFAWETEAGFLLLSDLGDRLLLAALKDSPVDVLYRQAMQQLLRMQECDRIPGWTLPLYDRLRLRDEMHLFHDWFISKYLGLTLDFEAHAILDNALESVLEQIQCWPVCFVHRDFHARNLMLLDNGELGIIDFQDAVQGPFNYDLISLLRDAYVVWPKQQVQRWMLEFAAELRQCGRLQGMGDTEFLRSCDWMSVQRHLKILGIFARLCLRDGKPGYLQDMPLVFAYLRDELQRLPALDGFAHWLDKQIIPAFESKSGRTLPVLPE